jgi:hypothetical protein
LPAPRPTTQDDLERAVRPTTQGRPAEHAGDRNRQRKEKIMSVIEVRGLTKRFGPMLAVDQLSFEVERGTVARDVS